MINGIPYLGEGNNSLISNILKSEIAETEEVTMYELVSSHIEDRILVIIDSKWLTWLDDIIFDYKNKKVLIPYFSYKVFDTEINVRDNNKGHLILKDGKVSIRHDFKINYIEIKKNSFIDIYDLKEEKRKKVKITGWIKEEPSVNKLYDLYLHSAYRENDNLLNKHNGGYHYIIKDIKKFTNRELRYRKIYELESFDKENEFMIDHRDVRNYRYGEVIKTLVIDESIDSYKIRRLKFESYLYCICREERQFIEDKYKDIFEKLRKGKRRYSIGNDIVLIIKDYWLDGIKRDTNKTYIK